MRYKDDLKQKLLFYKYHGAGNDFILMEDFSCSFPMQESALVHFLCSRNWGIGADGLILLQPSQKADVRMRVFNADGFEVELCGNALRCLLLHHRDMHASCVNIETQQGVLQGTLVQEGIARVELPAVEVLHWELRILGEEFFVVRVGVPHAIFFVTDINRWSAAQFEERGRQLRFHPDFLPEGVNVNAVQVLEGGVLLIRTYERGVEAETLSCGTGAAAASFVVWKRGIFTLPSLQVIPRSGIPLQFHRREGTIEMEGGASFVFEGSIDIGAFMSRAVL